MYTILPFCALYLISLDFVNMATSLFIRAMELRPGTKLWTRGVALYGLGQYSDAATFLEQCALAYVNKFEDRPTTELLWAAASRAKLGEASPYRCQPQQEGSSRSSTSISNPYGEALVADAEPVVVEDKLRALEVAAEDAQAAASAARDQWLNVNTAKAAAVQAEDYAQAAVLKTEADSLKSAADAAEARALKASAAVEEATAAADGGATGGDEADADPAAVLAKVKEVLAKYPREPNPLLAAAWKLFTGEDNLEALGAVVERAKAAARSVAGASSSAISPTRGGADPLGRVFLGHLYAGLWLDSASESKAAAAAHYTAAVQAAQVGSAFGGGYDAGFLEGFAATAGESAAAAAGDSDTEFVGEPSWTTPVE